MILILIIFVSMIILGAVIGYSSARMNLEKEADGYIHIVTEEGESQPYIFLELKDDRAQRVIEEADYISFKVIRD